MRKFVKCLVLPALVLAALVFAGGRTALADGWHHHHNHHRSYYGPPAYGRGCYPPGPPVYGYRAYRAVPYPAYPAYPAYGGQTSFYNRGPNYSFGFNYGW